MTLHQNTRAFQVLRGQAVHFMTRRSSSEFAPDARRAMAHAFDAGVLIVGTNDHKRHHMPSRVPLGRIEVARQEWGYGMGHGIYRCPDLGVRFFRAYEANMIAAGGKRALPTAIVLIATGDPALHSVPDHGDCSVVHYLYDPELGVLSVLTYIRTSIRPVHPGRALGSCRSAMESMAPGTVTDDERRILRRDGRGVRLHSTDGVVIVQGLTDAERLWVRSHTELCHEILHSPTDPDADQVTRLSCYGRSSVVGFAFGQDETRRFHFEHRIAQLEFREARQDAQEFRFLDVGGR